MRALSLSHTYTILLNSISQNPSNTVPLTLIQTLTQALGSIKYSTFYKAHCRHSHIASCASNNKSTELCQPRGPGSRWKAPRRHQKLPGRAALDSFKWSRLTRRQHIPFHQAHHHHHLRSARLSAGATSLTHRPWLPRGPMNLAQERILINLVSP